MTNPNSEATTIDGRKFSAVLYDAHVRKFCEPLCASDAPEVWTRIDSPWAQAKAHYFAAKLGIKM
jgi:hypothetical protein